MFFVAHRAHGHNAYRAASVGVVALEEALRPHGLRGQRGALGHVFGAVAAASVGCASLSLMAPQDAKCDRVRHRQA
jgi:hypothetical protein